MSKRLFKTMVAVLAIAAAATGPVRAQSTTESFTITFKTTGSESDGSSPQTTIAGIIANGADYVSEVNATKVYQAKDGYGIKLGSNSATGSLTLTLANAVENVTSIVVNARQYGDGTSERTLQIQGDNYTTTDAFADYTYTYTTPATVSTITLATTTKRAYIKSVTVNYTTSTGGGGSTPEPEPAPAVPITVRMAEGTEEAANWSIASGNASVPGTQVLENVMSGSQVTATYSGTTKKVKSVKAVKYVPPAATVATAPSATAAVIEVGSTAALVNAGAANGGSMMYAVTATNTQPASTADFSASVPTAEGRAAGTYYVWYYAKADAEHSDGEIAGPVSVTVAVMTTVTWNSSNVFNSAHQNDELNKWNTTPLTYEGITISFSGDGSASSFHAYDSGNQTGELKCFGQSSDSFIFTAPSGKKFARIEMTNNGTALSSDANWIKDGNKLVWSGTPSNTVEIAGDGLTQLSTLNTIVFKLIDAQ